ncbi:MAG: hypothetical protein IPN69_06945 [Acidobacteria bacterium]|nr:hypothetical protein [Acidobacteriota bacterium]
MPTKTTTDAIKKWIDDVTHNPIFWVVISFVIGFLIKFFTPDNLDASKGVVYLLSVAGALVGLIIGTLYRHREIASQLSKLEESVEDLSEKSERHNRLNQSLSFLEQGIVDDRFLQVTSDISGAYKNIQVLKTQHPDCLDFFEWKERKIFDATIPKLDELSAKHIVIDDEYYELIANKQFLTRLPKINVRAISYQDNGFWDEPAGKDFLKAHSEMINKNVRITRIFILSEEEIVSQRRVIEQQLTMKIEVKIAEKAKLSAKELEDFVIYDDNYVRYAKLITVTETNTLKHATLTVDTNQVKGFIDKFNSLYAKSVEATEFYANRDVIDGPEGRILVGY